MHEWSPKVVGLYVELLSRSRCRSFNLWAFPLKRQLQGKLSHRFLRAK